MCRPFCCELLVRLAQACPAEPVVVGNPEGYQLCLRGHQRLSAPFLCLLAALNLSTFAAVLWQPTGSEETAFLLPQISLPYRLTW